LNQALGNTDRYYFHISNGRLTKDPPAKKQNENGEDLADYLIIVNEDFTRDDLKEAVIG
jgi:hypothetical protein